MTHSIKHALNRVCGFCSEKSYPMPTTDILLTIVEPYFAIDGLFTKEEFFKVWIDMAKGYRIELPAEVLEMSLEMSEV